MENLITIVNNEAVLDVNAIDTLINLEERIKKMWKECEEKAGQKLFPMV